MSNDIKFEIDLNFAQRGPFIRGLKEICYKHNLEINIEEDKGWIMSSYRIYIHGNNMPSSLASAIIKWIQNPFID